MTMNITHIENEIIQFLEKNILSEGVKITANEELRSVSIDSFSIVEIILFIERRFGFVIPDEKLIPENFQTVHAIAKIVAETEA